MHYRGSLRQWKNRQNGRANGKRPDPPHVRYDASHSEPPDWKCGNPRQNGS
jgi:hypothetical protein